MASSYAKRFALKELFSATIKNRFSHLRNLASWIDKPGLVKPIHHYADLPIKRSTKASTSKAWCNKGIDAKAKTDSIKTNTAIKNEILRVRISDALLLQLELGLRSKESILFKPHLADKGNVLIINHGAKGGRNRYVSIDNAEQRALIDRIKSYIGLNDSLIPNEMNYENFRRQYYNALKIHGISRKDGITAHGLRHQKLNDLYEQVTGEKTPVNDSDLYKRDKELHKLGCNYVADTAGHTHPQIAAAYIGGPRKNQEEENIETQLPKAAASF